MKHRIAIWVGAGFLIACGWVAFTFVMPPDRLVIDMAGSLARILLAISCPVVFALRSLPLAFWWVPLINAATYAVIGLTVEGLLRGSRRATVRFRV